MKLHGSLYLVRTIRTWWRLIAVAVACAAVAACGLAGNVDAYLNRGYDSLNTWSIPGRRHFEEALQPEALQPLQPDIAADLHRQDYLGVAYLQSHGRLQ